jgi:VWFA-related protein
LASLGIAPQQITVFNGRKPVTGLTKEHFRVLDDGALQQLTSVAVETLGLDVMLLMDESASTWRRPLGTAYEFRNEGIKAWLAEAQDATKRALEPTDRLRVFRFSTTLTEERADITLTVPRADLLTARKGRTALLDVIGEAFMMPAPVNQRRVILVVSDGRDSSSILDDRTLLTVADRSDATLFLLAVGGRTLRGIPDDLFWIDGYEGLLDFLATRSGGRMLKISPDSRVTDLVQPLLRELRTQYVLTYVPSGSKPGWHDIDVEVPGKKYDLRAKRGYWR